MNGKVTMFILFKIFRTEKKTSRWERQTGKVRQDGICGKDRENTRFGEVPSFKKC